MSNATWIFVLNSEPLGELKLEFAPEGWDEQRISILRSPQYKGLRRGVSTKLRFVEDGKDYIQQIREENGTETEVGIKIYQYAPKPVDKYTFYFEGIVDISTYHSDEDIFVECDINESSFVTKLMSRDSIKIDLNTIESIDGVALDPINEVTVQLHQREILAIGGFILDESAATVQSTLVISQDIGWEGFTLPIALDTSSNDVDNLSTQSSPLLFDQGSIFWNPAGQDSIVTLSGTVTGTLRNAFAQSASATNVEFRIRVYTDDTLTDIDFDVPITGSDFVIPTDGSDVPFTFGIDIQLGGSPPAVNLTAEATISLICINPDASSTGYKGFEAEFTQTNFAVAQNLQWTDGTQAQGYLIFDAFEKITEAITDTKDSFKSAYFGPGGEGRLQTILSGKQIRQFPNTYVSESFETLFKSMDAQHNIGIGIEYDEFGNPYVRCEKEEYFYNGNVIFTVHNVSELTKDVARDKIYNEIEVGYIKAEYEEVNGLEEYNNKFEWTDFIKTIKNKLSLVSKIRGDGYGIEFARRKPFDQYPTEDTKYDNDNFTVIVIPDGLNYQNARLENYDFAENIFSPETAYNLDITPGRMLRAHGGKIRAGLKHYLSEPIKFQFAEQLSDLRSQRTGEGPITENEDINAATLTAQRWIPDLYLYKSVFTRDQLEKLALNPNGIIKFTAASKKTVTNYFYGWLNEIDNESDKDTAVWELLRVDTTSPSVTIIDPEGDSPDIPIPPIDPSVVQGTFEGTFPFVFMGPETGDGFQLLETGDNKLLETGDKKLLEDG